MNNLRHTDQKLPVWQSESDAHAMSLAQAPIGVFDSGLGGLSVLKAIRAALPHEHLIYVADSAHAPYGERDANYVIKRTLAISRFLLERPVKCLVVACNTATAMAIDALRTECTVPIIAIEPAIKPAIATSQNQTIGVLATSGTLASPAFKTLCQRFTGNSQLILQACPGLVEQVEQGELNSTATRALLQTYLQPLLDAGADTIVLGCTHYPFLIETLRDLLGAQITIIEPSAAVARELHNRLHRHQLLQAAPQAKHSDNLEQFYSNGDLIHAQNLISLLWGEQVRVQALPVL